MTHTSVIQATSPSTPTHLDVLSTADPAIAATIKLAHVGEHNSLGWHVESSGEGLCARRDSKMSSSGFRLVQFPISISSTVDTTVLAGMLSPVEKVSAAEHNTYEAGKFN